MEYQVPQFVEVEDKIIGPLTLKQFIYLAGGGGLTAVLILYLPLYLGILLSIPVVALSGALAFYKVNNKNFVDILEAGFKYYIGDRLYLWKKEPKAVSRTPEVSMTPVEEPARQKLGMSRGRLQELAWSLDIKDNQPPEAS
ncbi:MAG: PrgI family protein [Patescibacteria group bacterium]